MAIPHDPTFVPVDHLKRPAREKAEIERARGIDVRGLEVALRKRVEGEVRFDAASRALYAHDASNYRHVPIGVVLPRSKEDVYETVAAARAFGAPIVSRGGGTGLAGQTTNYALVIDHSKYMRRIDEIDPERRIARVEPGVVCDELVAAAKKHGLTWGPQPATHSRCCFGGMLSNNCGGMRAQMAGKAVDNTEGLDVLLYDGTYLDLGWMNEAELETRIRAGGRAGEVYAKMRDLRDRYAEKIRTGYPKLPRRVSGYNLDELLPKEDGRFNLARTIVGSESTLATILECTLRLVPDPPERVVVVIGYRDVYEACDAVPQFLRFHPTALEGMDDILKHHIGKKGGRHAKNVNVLPEGKGWLLIEVGAWSKDEAKRLGDEIVRCAKREGPRPVSFRLLEDKDEQERLWDMREGGLGSTAFVPDEPDTWPGWEDSAVKPEVLGGYLRDFRALLDRYGYRPALYGHFGMGVVHCRIDFDLYNENGVRAYRGFVGEAADLVVRYGGSLSGEHGDGQSRAELLVKMFGPELMQAMREFKAILDPGGKMNPGKVVDPYPIVTDLKVGPRYEHALVDTHFRYPDDGGSFERATLRCVGVGKCRRESASGEGDVMCPSYMVTREEKHSTRGRAHLLWEMLQQETPVDGRWRDEGVKEALDLCLSCKGCKGDCPVNVDIATYKAEFLSHYYEGRIRPRHAYAFGHIDEWARVASIAPGLVNLVTQLPGTRAVAKLVAGVAQDAPIPTFAPQSFQSWWKARGPKVRSGKKVVLWPDTFNNFMFPDTAKAAVEVLEHAGFEIVVPETHVCCGRPLYDFGMLDEARVYLGRVLATMKPHLDQDLPIVVLEPSCASVFRDELHNLMPARDDAAKMRDRTMVLSELLVKEAKDAPLPRVERKAIVQGHCHHKSVLGFDEELEVMKKAGLDFELLDSGCCGMAGSFGFEAHTRPVAEAAGERVLLPRVRDEKDDTIVVADGFSCREQIQQHTPRAGLHLAEVLALGLHHGPKGPEGRPEAAIVEARRADVRRSMLRAGVALAAAAATVTAIAVWRSRK